MYVFVYITPVVLWADIVSHAPRVTPGTDEGRGGEVTAATRDEYLRGNGESDNTISLTSVPAAQHADSRPHDHAETGEDTDGTRARKGGVTRGYPVTMVSPLSVR